LFISARDDEEPIHLIKLVNFSFHNYNEKRKMKKEKTACHGSDKSGQ